MAFYDVDRLKAGISRMLEAIKGTEDEKFLLDMQKLPRPLEDPLTTLEEFMESGEAAAHCKCPKCCIVSSLCRTESLKFMHVMNRVLNEEDATKREEILIRELSFVYGTLPTIMKAALLAKDEIELIDEEPRPADSLPS